MEPKLVPFAARDLEELTPRDYGSQEMAVMGDRLTVGRLYEQVGPAYTVRVRSQIMVCGGVAHYWPGVGEAWVVTTDLIPRYPLSFHRTVKRMLRQLCRDMGLQRLQAAVPANHTVSRKWLERLGFRQEGLMPMYGPQGKTYVRYGYLPNLGKET